jgi:hypothetical protein
MEHAHLPSVNKTKPQVDDEVSLPKSVTQVFGVGSSRTVPAAELSDAGARLVANQIDLSPLNIRPSAKNGWETGAKSTQFFFGFGA